MGSYVSSVRLPARAILVARSCYACGEFKQAGDFKKERKVCNTCDNARRRRSHNPAKRSVQYRRWYYERGGREKVLASRYGLTNVEYNVLMAEGCAICGSHENPCLDHDHIHGTVRGCLCKGCNTVIGFVGEDAGLLRAAADYLEDVQRRVNA